MNTPTDTNQFQRQAQRLASKLVPRGLMSGALLAVLCLALPSRVLAGHDVALGKDVAGPNGNFANATAHIGDTITARLSITNADTFLDHITITNIHDIIHYASGDVTTANLLAAPVTLAFGQGISVTHTYIAAPGNAAASPTAGNATVLSDDAQFMGVDNRDAAGGLPTALNLFKGNTVALLIPSIECKKFCTDGVGPTGTIGFSGYVTNTGNTDLGNVGVTNSVNGVLTIVTNISLLPVGTAVNFSGSYQGVCGPNRDIIFVGGGDALGSNVTSQCEATCINVCTPSIKVYKQVVCDIGTGCEAFDSAFLIPPTQHTATGAEVTNGVIICPTFCYQVTVTNTGNVPLTGLTVTDLSTPGPNILPSASCNFPSTLAVGGVFSCIVTNIERCANDVNVVTATAQGLNSFGTNQTVTAKDTNTVVIVPINVKCTLLVSTNGPAGDFFVPSVCATQQLALGNTYCVRIVVNNNGGYDLQNVTISDELGTFGTCFVSPLNLGSLAIGNSATQTCCNLPCGAIGSPTNFKIAVKGDASQAHGHICAFDRFRQPIQATNECSTCVVCTGCPEIKVFKGIACVVCSNDGSGVTLFCASARGIFEPIAYGVRSDTQDPAFCYEIAVTNSGAIDLQNVTIKDAVLGLNLNIGTLTKGGSGASSAYTNNFLKSLHVTTTNTVIATGDGGPGAVGCPGANASGQVSATNQAVAVVTPISITCAKLVSVSQDGGPASAFAPSFTTTNCGASTNVIVWQAWVTNTGLADLTNVVMTDEAGHSGLPGCTVSNYIGSLAVGHVAGPFNLCTNVLGCVDTNIVNFIRVVGEAAQEGTNCIWDIHGSNIVAASDCNASVTLCCVVPTVGCRVTGGGRQDYNDPKADTIEVCPPDSRYVTHGGQVGAPYGNAITNCPDQGACNNLLAQTLLVDNIIGNVCIHGRWTHVRHVKGGLEGNFHARFYDTLDCSCLGVDFNTATGLYELGDTTTVPGRCNPGDRIAGPEPRKAPANKIVFTGVGDWADPNGRRTPRSVLFRVDIEDRSEPGGYHPGGAKPPADRYRIRIWVLTPQECAALHGQTGAGIDTGLLHFRSAIAACYGINQRDGVIAAFEQNNCGTAGTMFFGGGGQPAGCHVRLPDIDDGGEMKNGNHQIHPTIKPCDPANPQGPGLANSGSDCSNQ